MNAVLALLASVFDGGLFKRRQGNSLLSSANGPRACAKQICAAEEFDESNIVTLSVLMAHYRVSASMNNHKTLNYNKLLKQTNRKLTVVSKLIRFGVFITICVTMG